MAKRKIMLIDDEEGFVRLLQMNLEQTGDYEIRVENRGKPAVESARWFKPDLILLDVIMPDISGIEVARQLKEHPKTADIPIVYLTATVSREEASEEGGVIDGLPSLAKPVTVEEVVACIRKTLSSAASK